MSKQQLHRASEVSEFTGRTMEGIAYRYDRPSRVSDDAFATTYFEEITRGADVKTLTEKKEFPLYKLHNRAETPLGTVTFAHSEDESALIFTALVNRSEAGDQVLEDEEWRDVSVGFAPIRNATRKTEYHGNITQRIEIRLEELSLAPNGTGLNKGAEVLAVRAQTVETPRLIQLRKKLILL